MSEILPSSSASSASASRSRNGTKTLASRAAYSSWASLNSPDQSLLCSDLSSDSSR